MGENALVESQITDAIALIQRLDSQGDAPTLAAWYYYDDAAEWHLLIGGPTFDTLLKNRQQQPLAYRKIAEAMAQITPSALTMSDIKIVDSQAALPRAIRLLIGTAPNGIVRAHFTDNMLNGIFIKEMIVLRSATASVST
jgi:hypothetical protein